MPANLPPQWFVAEVRYREAKTIPEKIQALEELIRLTPKHKGSENLLAQLKRRMAKLKEQSEKQRFAGAHGAPVFSVKKEGAAQIVLVGPANVGKSSLFNNLTTAESEVADYPFTTTRPIPGMMRFENIQLQLVDTPPIVDGEKSGQVFSLIRSADEIAIVVDSFDQIDFLVKEFDRTGIFLNEKLPDFLDLKGQVSKKAIIVLNKADIKSFDIENISQKYPNFKIIPASAKTKANLESLKQNIFQTLEIIRVYTKSPGKEPNYTQPLVLKKGSTIFDAAILIHKDFAEKLKFAKVWGNSVEFPGKQVKREHILLDGDIVEFHVR